MQKWLNNYGSFVTFNFFNMNKNQCVWKIPSKVLSLEIYGFDCRTNLWEYQCWNKIKLWRICQMIGGIMLYTNTQLWIHGKTNSKKRLSDAQEHVLPTDLPNHSSVGMCHAQKTAPKPDTETNKSLSWYIYVYWSDICLKTFTPKKPEDSQISPM
jgi:hypothetical protein